MPLPRRLEAHPFVTEKSLNVNPVTDSLNVTTTGIASSEVSPEIGEVIVTSGRVVSTMIFAFSDSDPVPPSAGRVRFASLVAASRIDPPLRTNASVAVYSRSADVCPVCTV